MTTGLHNAEEMLESINADECEAPDLLSWREWQTWRAGSGRRPAVRRGDATSTTIQEEGVMWRDVMEAVHGPDWRMHIRQANTDPGLAGGSELLGDDKPETALPAADGAVPSGASPAKVGGGSRSQYADTASSGRPGAEELRRRLLLDIDPIKETLAVFSSRIDRIATVIALHADPVSQQELNEIKIRGEYMLFLHGLAGDTQVTFLKDQLSDVLITEELQELEREIRSRVLMELLRARGQRASKNTENLFSTATNSKDPTPEKSFPSLTQRVMNPTPTATPQPKRSASGNKRYAEQSSAGGGDTPRSKYSRKPGTYDDDRCSQASPHGNEVLAEAIQAQTAAMLELMKSRGEKKLSSTIRVNPTVQWPKLSDEGPDCREVEEFFEKFDETCNLANDGAGMADKERLKVLSACLRGSREKTYQVLLRKHRLLGCGKGPRCRFQYYQGKAYEVCRDGYRETDEGVAGLREPQQREAQCSFL